MNRRNFIGTLTALAGVVLAKIKAPAKPRLTATAAMIAEANRYPAVHYAGGWRRGVAMLTRCAWCEKVTPHLLHWTAQGADGFYHGAAVCRDCYALIQKARSLKVG